MNMQGATFHGEGFPKLDCLHQVNLQTDLWLFNLSSAPSPYPGLLMTSTGKYMKHSGNILLGYLWRRSLESWVLEESLLIGKTTLSSGWLSSPPKTAPDSDWTKGEARNTHGFFLLQQFELACALYSRKYIIVLSIGLILEVNFTFRCTSNEAKVNQCLSKPKHEGERAFGPVGSRFQPAQSTMQTT
jgi:hypothetical protein